MNIRKHGAEAWAVLRSWRVSCKGRNMPEEGGRGMHAANAAVETRIDAPSHRRLKS